MLEGNCRDVVFAHQIFVPYLNDLESEFEELSSSEEEKETSNENEDETSKMVEVAKVQGESSEEESSEEEDSYEESESEEEQPVKAVC